MNETVARLHVGSEDDEFVEELLRFLPESLAVPLGQIAWSAREGLLALSVEVGLATVVTMMEAELTERIGRKHAKIPAGERGGNWWGTAASSVVIGGRKVALERPRGRSVDGAELDLETWAAFSDESLLTEVVLERMWAGLATRRHARAAEPVGAAVDAASSATSKSAVSRRWVQGTQKALDELLSRDLSDLEVAVMMLDGVIFAEHCCVAALAITRDGAKVPVGLWLGDTENKTVVKALLADLVARGLDASAGMLFVLDGAKALAAGVRDVFGDQALVQRCTLHKRRNVRDHLPKDVGERVDRRLGAAFADADWHAGHQAALKLAGELERQWPDAAASLREGLDDMFCVRRLGIDGTLARTLTTTNAIESMISTARDVTRNVKRWRDGRMVKRWCAAGMREAQRRFRRLKGHEQMGRLVAALEAHVAAVTAEAVA